MQLLHDLGFRDAVPAVSIVDTYLDDVNCTLTSHNYCQQSSAHMGKWTETRLFVKQLTKAPLSLFGNCTQGFVGAMIDGS